MKRYLSLFLVGIVLLAGCGSNVNSYGEIKKYTEDYVLERCGLAGLDEFSDDGNTWYYNKDEYGGYTSIYIMYEDSPYYKYNFLIFKNEKSACKELERRKESFFKEKELQIGQNYACGWEAGVMDASVKVFDYQSLNLIVEVDDEHIGFDTGENWEEWQADYYSEEAAKVREESIKELHNTIMSEW